MLAAQRGNPIRKLVLNDVGAFVAKEGLNRIGAYLGDDPTFDSLEAMEARSAQKHAPFGALTDAQWRKMALDSARKKPDGGYGFAYDPRIGDPFKAGPVEDVDLWPVWDAIQMPDAAAARRTHPTSLQRDVAEAMTKRGPKAKLVEFPGVGHAPPLLSEDQIGAVRDFLLG